MMRTLWILLITSAVGGGAYYAGVQRAVPPAADPVTHRPNAPQIEQVRALASLVTLDVPISDLHVSEMTGVTGGVEIAVDVRGDVQVMTDLDNARFDDIDHDRREAVLVLPRPEPRRPRVDHEKTRILKINRSGLWRFAPGDGGERVLTDRAMLAAQRVLSEAAQDEELVDRACEQTERVMREFFGALDWSVVIRWDDPAADPEAADEPAATAAAAAAD